MKDFLIATLIGIVTFSVSLFVLSFVPKDVLIFVAAGSFGGMAIGTYITKLSKRAREY